MSKIILKIILLAFLLSQLNYKTAKAEEAVAGISTVLNNITYVYTTDNVNLREEPNTSSLIFETLKKNTEVMFVSYEKKWVKVFHNGRYGYLHTDYVTETKWDITQITDEEIEILYRIVEAECEGQSKEAKRNVASVIINRVYSVEFPSSIKDVVFQKDQFSPITDKRYFKVVITKETEEAVNYITEKGVTNNALYFTNMSHITSKSKKDWFGSLDYLFKDDSGHSFFR